MTKMSYKFSHNKLMYTSDSDFYMYIKITHIYVDFSYINFVLLTQIGLLVYLFPVF